MAKHRIGLLASLCGGAALSLLAFAGPANAKALRRDLTVFQSVPYSIVPKLNGGLTEWQMSSPGQALAIHIRCKSKVATDVTIHGATVQIASMTSHRFPSNLKLGIKPNRTTFTLSVPEGRGRTAGLIKYLK